MNLPVSVGDNLISCPLLVYDQATWHFDNSITNVLVSGVPEGSTFAEWDAMAQQFLPASQYSEAGGWSIGTYDLWPGEGAVLHCPAAGTITLVGNTVEERMPPERGDGLHLISGSDTFSGATFERVIGRPPADGESVRTLDGPSQAEKVTTFHAGKGWDNGIPTLVLGQAAWFSLNTLKLSVSLNATGELVLSWPVGPSVWQLQESPPPDGTSWTDVVVEPQEVNGRRQVVLGPRAGPQLYRLKK